MLSQEAADATVGTLTITPRRPAQAVGGAGAVVAGAAISGGFGLVGGRIAAKSMRNRTAPLQEFSFASVGSGEARIAASSHSLSAPCGAQLPARQPQNPSGPADAALCPSLAVSSTVTQDDGRPRLAVTICLSGWLTEGSGFVDPWKHVGSDDAERIAVCWESRQLLRLGRALKDFVAEAGTVELVKAGIMHSALQGLLSAVALPATMLTATSFIDNAWSTCLDRADQASLLLADALYDSAWYGHRPVTLIGFSLGARVIFGCASLRACCV